MPTPMLSIFFCFFSLMLGCLPEKNSFFSVYCVKCGLFYLFYHLLSDFISSLLSLIYWDGVWICIYAEAISFFVFNCSVFSISSFVYLGLGIGVFDIFGYNLLSLFWSYLILFSIYFLFSISITTIFNRSLSKRIC